MATAVEQPVPTTTHHPEEQQPVLNEKVADDRASLHSSEKKELDVTHDDETQPHEMKIVNDGNPFPDDPGLLDEPKQLTVRAVAIGSMLGLIVGASNVYLGLKTGFTFGAALFGAIFGFAIIKPLSHALPTWFGGGYFGPRENCSVQTAATSAGGLTSLFVAAVPAMYHLGLMTTPRQDLGRLFLLTAITAFYGLFFAIPLRKYYILKQKLVFPTPTATAFTIRSLHSTTSAAARIAAKHKVRILAGSFFGTFIWKTLCGYAPGLLLDWHIFWWFYSWGWKGAIYGEAWGWIIEITPAFFGCGMLSGLNASWSFMAGAILAWGFIGPLTIKYGVAVSRPRSETIPEFLNYFSMSAPNNDYVNFGSPRYWLLWPGVMIMLCYSFAEVAASAPLFYRSIKQVIRNISYSHREWSAKRKNVPFNEERLEEDLMLDDPAPKEEQVQVWNWVIGLTISVIGTLVVGKLSFNMDVGIGILALILAFIFSFIGVQSSGTTDVNPVGTIAKASQLVIGGITKGQGIPIEQAQMTNLIAGTLAGQAASHAVDMVGDLKTGHLLRAAPRTQYYAQILGSVVGIWLSVGLFVLFATAYPCITDMEIECTAFGMPAVAAWRSVAIAVTAPTLPINRSCGITAIVLGIVSVLTVVIKYAFIPQKYWVYVPNWNAIGLGFVVPQVYYPFAMIVGAHAAHIWEKRWPKGWELWGFALSAGLVAGEGMGGVMNALLTIVGADGSIHGSPVACPENMYCG